MLASMRSLSINHKALCEEQKIQLKPNSKKSSAIIILRRSSFSFSGSVSEGIRSGGILFYPHSLP
jgi:hypothetical protein